MKEHPKVSVIIPNWNGLQYLNECLVSLSKQTYTDFEIIVVDNGSTDGSVEFIRAKYPQVRLIVNSKNLGFAVAVSIGIRAAKGEYILPLNNDTAVDQNWIAEMVKSAEAPDVWAVASKLLFYDKREHINSSGIIIFADGSAIDRQFGELDDRHNEEEEVFGPTAGACLYKRKILDEIGLFDENYFAYYEDVDLAWRARLAGWKCIYNPKAIVYHKFSATTKSGSPLVIYLCERNRIWTYIKNLSLSYQFRYAHYFLIHIFGAIGQAGAFKGVKDAFKQLPEIWQKYKEVQKLRKVPDCRIKKWIHAPPYKLWLESKNKIGRR